ncbi:MAG TPA: hypothetical protein VIO94_06040, partial [Phenylobacterium sp.]
TSQLGWPANEMAVLVRGDGEPGALAAVERLDVVPLTPTIRPRPSDTLTAGGVYVHRWFHVLAQARDEFVALSGQGWGDFEGRFEAKVFGLLTADEAPGEIVRFLLITRYGDHGEWERSRDPSTAAMQTFTRRQQLTVWTTAASTLLTAL